MTDQARPEVTAQSFHDVFVGGLDREARNASDTVIVLESMTWFLEMLIKWKEENETYEGAPWLDIAVRLESAGAAARRLAGG